MNEQLNFYMSEEDKERREEVRALVQKGIQDIRDNREKWEREFLEFVNDPEVQAYYKDPRNILY